MLADERTLSADIEQVIKKAVKSDLRDIHVFSVYRDAEMEPGKKSVSFRMTFGADDHTLKSDEVENLQNRVMDSLAKAGYPLK